MTSLEEALLASNFIMAAVTLAGNRPDAHWADDCLVKRRMLWVIDVFAPEFATYYCRQLDLCDLENAL